MHVIANSVFVDIMVHLRKAYQEMSFKYEDHADFHIQPVIKNNEISYDKNKR